MKITKLIQTNGDEIPLGDLTILVGPNNVGKSQTLRDINGKLETGKDAKTILINKIEFADITYDELIKTLSIHPHPTLAEQQIMKGINSTLTGGVSFNVRYENLKSCFQGDPPKVNWDALISNNVGKLKVALLNAESRLQIASKKGTKSRKNPPENLLQDLFDKKKTHDKDLLNAFKDAFNKEIILDYSDGQLLIFRVDDKIEKPPDDPRDAGPILENIPTLDNQGDGYRSFVGVVLGLLLTDDRIILIDEPEAFLHPTQARVLGNKIATISKKSQIIVATHSSDILDGILSGGKDVTIFRMNRSNNTTSFKKISSEVTSKLAKSPLLSSQPIQEAIFYEGVIVCEGDSDRCIYETVYSKIFNDKRILFVHTYSKQQIQSVTKILKDATIPVCAITDIDILNSENDMEKLIHSLKEDFDTHQLLVIRKKISDYVNGTEEQIILSNLKNETQEFLKELSEGKHSDLSNAKSALKRIRNNASKWQKIKLEGINALPESLQDDAKILIDCLKKIGFFIVPAGELESWWDVGTTIKKDWIVNALEKLETGDPPQSLQDFVKSFKSFFSPKED